LGGAERAEAALRKADVRTRVLPMRLMRDAPPRQVSRRRAHGDARIAWRLQLSAARHSMAFRLWRMLAGCDNWRERTAADKASLSRSAG